MRRIVVQLRTVRHRLLRRILQRWRDVSSLRPTVNLVQAEPREPRELSALRVTAMATVFNLTTSDSLAFPDTALDFQKRLFGLLGLLAPMEDDAR